MPAAAPCRSPAADATRALAPTESDSDDDIESFTNRGNKLKKKARFTRKGQLVPAEGPSSYKEARAARPLLSALVAR